MNTKLRNELLFLISQVAFMTALFVFKNAFWFFFILNTACILFYSFYIFKIDLKRKEILKNLNFLLMPVLFFVSVFFFLAILKSVLAQIFLIIVYLYASPVFIRAILKLRSTSDKMMVSSRNTVTIMSLMTFFLVSVDIINFFILYKLNILTAVIPLALATFFITNFLFKQFELTEITLFSLFSSFLVSQVFLAGSFWMVNYPRSKTGELGIPLVSIIIFIVYYAFWGIAHHKLTNTLTKNVLKEYLTISIVIIIVLLTTVRWMPLGIIGN